MLLGYAFWFNSNFGGYRRLNLAKREEPQRIAI